MVSHSLDVLARLNPGVPPELIGRAERWAADGTVIQPRVSASVILLRDGAAGLETYLLHRHARMAFAASMVVFPGGGVDDVDRSDGADPVLACALRETAEETGVALVDTDLLPWAHWITPEFEPRRFDTRFFLTALPVGQLARDVSGEADAADWMRVTDAVRAFDDGRLAMLPPTIEALRELSVCPDVASALAAPRTVRPILPRLVADGDDLRLVVE